MANPVANPLTLVMTIKSEKDYQQLKNLIEGFQKLPPEKNPIRVALAKLGIVHFDEISAVERIDAGLDLCAQCFQFQRIFSPPLLEHAERVTHGFARILILTGFHDSFDEVVLLGC